MGRDHARIKCNQILSKKKMKIGHSPSFRYPYWPPFGKKRVFSPRSNRIFPNSPKCLRIGPGTENIKKVYWAYVDSYDVMHSTKAFFTLKFSRKHPSYCSKFSKLHLEIIYSSIPTFQKFSRTKTWKNILKKYCWLTHQWRH